MKAPGLSISADMNTKPVSRVHQHVNVHTHNVPTYNTKHIIMTINSEIYPSQ